MRCVARRGCFHMGLSPELRSEIVDIDGEFFLLVHPPPCPHCHSADTVWDEDEDEETTVVCNQCQLEFRSK